MSTNEINDYARRILNFLLSLCPLFSLLFADKNLLSLHNSFLIFLPSGLPENIYSSFFSFICTLLDSIFRLFGLFYLEIHNFLPFFLDFYLKFMSWSGYEMGPSINRVIFCRKKREKRINLFLWYLFVWKIKI